MSYFAVKEIAEDVINSKLYRLDFYSDRLNLSEEEMRKIFACINDYLRRVHKVYPDVSFIMGLSTSESDSCHKVVVKTGKRGRPKKIVEGKKVAPHIHIAGVGKKVNPALKMVKDKIDKKFIARAGVKVSKISPLTGLCFVDYIDSQADSCRSVGDFDFDCLKYAL